MPLQSRGFKGFATISPIPARGPSLRDYAKDQFLTCPAFPPSISLVSGLAEWQK